MKKTRWSVLLVVAGLAASSPAYLDEDGFFHANRFEERFISGMTEATRDQAIPRETLTEQLQAEHRHALASSGTPLDPQPLDALYRQRVDTVVGVGATYLCGNCDHLHANLAGGVVIHSDGYILTNHHVVEAGENHNELGVITYDGRVWPVLEVLASDRLNDVALIRIDATGLPAAPLAADVQIGETIAVISHPRGRYYTMTDGVVSSKSQQSTQHGLRHQVTITADYARGSSGCPVFNTRGEVVGLVASTHTLHYETTYKPGTPQAVQMVWKNIVPHTALHTLLSVGVSP
jgi:serine protease Do